MLSLPNLKHNVHQALKEPGHAVNVFTHRFKSLVTYVTRDGASAYPETISLFLTFRCNLRCHMCAQWGTEGAFYNMSPAELKNELSLDEMKKLLDELATFKPSLTFFGGEPFAYRKWPEVLLYAKQKGLRVNCVTNGTLLVGRAKEMVENGMDQVIFSLEGPREGHDATTRVAGSFDRATQAMKEITAYKKESGRKNPRISVNSTISETNYRTILEIAQVAKEIGASDITYHHVLFMSKKNYEDHNVYFKEKFDTASVDFGGFVRKDLPNIDIDFLLSSMREARRRYPEMSIAFYPNLSEDEIRLWYTQFDYVPKSYWTGCMSPWVQAYIFPDGSVRPCEELNFEFGNLHQHSFKELWNNERARRYRSVVKNEGTFKVCPRCTEYYRL